MKALEKRVEQTITQINMGRISSYGTTTDIKGTDKLLATDPTANKSTKNITVDQLSAYAKETIISDTALGQVGVKLRWSAGIGTGWSYISQRSFNNQGTPIDPVKVPLLHMEFENLVLEDGVTYEVVLERFTRGRKRGVENAGYKKSGMKIEQSIYTGTPYSARPVSLPIITPGGALYDFKFDYYFKLQFPQRSGGRLYTSHQPESTKQAIGFRIKTTDSNGVVKLSPTLRKINLTGGLSGDGNNGIGFSEL